MLRNEIRHLAFNVLTGEFFVVRMSNHMQYSNAEMNQSYPLLVSSKLTHCNGIDICRDQTHHFHPVPLLVSLATLYFRTASA